MLECARGKGTVYYIGITTDLQRRYSEHRRGAGARFTRANKPVRILAFKEYPDRSSASSAEIAVKRLARHQKPAFFDSCG